MRVITEDRDAPDDDEADNDEADNECGADIGVGGAYEFAGFMNDSADGLRFPR